VEYLSYEDFVSILRFEIKIIFYNYSYKLINIKNCHYDYRSIFNVNRIISTRIITFDSSYGYFCKRRL